MAKSDSTEAPDDPVDLTAELPLDDENVLAAEPSSVWRRHRWPILGAVVVLIAAATGLTVWLTSGSSTPAGLTVTTVTVTATTGNIQQTVASSGTLEPASQANLNFAVSGTVTAVEREGRPDGHRRPGAGDGGHHRTVGRRERGPGAAHLGRGPSLERRVSRAPRRARSTRTRHP